MKILYKFFFPLVAVCLVLAGCTGRGGAWREVDVCVYGGTAAGVMGMCPARIISPAQISSPIWRTCCQGAAA